MSENRIIRLISSIPVILVLLYFLPFVGVCLIIFRYFVYKDRKIYELPIVLLIIALILLLPRGAELILNTIKQPLSLIPFLSNIVTSDIYAKIIKYSKFLFTIGIITMIVSYLVRTLYYKATTKLSSALRTGFNDTVNTYIEKESEIKEKNDLKIREQQERAKNTRAVKCPTCGHKTFVSDNATRCPFCRGPLS